MSAYHPTFGAGHCFMGQTLNKQEVEFLGEILGQRLKTMSVNVPLHIEQTDFDYEVRRTNRILEKMDHPLFEQGD